MDAALGVGEAAAARRAVRWRGADSSCYLRAFKGCEVGSGTSRGWRKEPAGSSVGGGDDGDSGGDQRGDDSRDGFVNVPGFWMIMAFAGVAAIAVQLCLAFLPSSRASAENTSLLTAEAIEQAKERGMKIPVKDRIGEIRVVRAY